MHIETTPSGYKIILPVPYGKSEYYAFRHKGSSIVEIHKVFNKGGCIVNPYQRSNGCWVDAFFNFYKIEEGSLEYKAFEMLSSIKP